MTSHLVNCYIRQDDGTYAIDPMGVAKTLETCFRQHVLHKEDKGCGNCVLYTAKSSVEPPSDPGNNKTANWLGCSYTNENGFVCQ